MQKELTGNYFNKYESTNCIYRILVRNFRKTLIDLVRNLPVNTCLEIGSGEGYILEYLHEAKPDMHLNGSEIIYPLTIGGKKNNPYAIWSVLRGENLAFTGSSFDLVVACEVLEHVKQPEIMMDEMKRVSSKYILLSVPYEPIWRMLNILRLKYLRNFGNTPGHLNHWSPSTILRVSEKYFHVSNIKVSFPWIFIIGEKIEEKPIS